MPKYEAVTSVYETVRKTQHVRRPGTVVELTEEDAERLLAVGAVKELGDEDVEADDTTDEDVELPARPSNSGTKEEWRAYLVQLEAVTTDELGPLDVPADAKRDDMIRIGDQRVATWNSVQ
jgi:hypothetical protein